MKKWILIIPIFWAALSLGSCGLAPCKANTPFPAAADISRGPAASRLAADKSEAGDPDTASNPEPDDAFLAEPTVIFSPEETFCERAVKFLSTQTLDKNPTWELGLFDLDLDGIPELMTRNIGGWAGNCQFYDLSGEAAVFLCGTTWSVTKETCYVKDAAWRLEDTGGHGFSSQTWNSILYFAEDGLHLITCQKEILVTDTRTNTPYSWFFGVTHELKQPSGPAPLPGTLIEEESLCFGGEEEPDLQGTLYDTLLQDDWTEIAAPWVLETELYNDRHAFIAQYYSHRPTSSELAERINALYAAWETRHGA